LRGTDYITSFMGVVNCNSNFLQCTKFGRRGPVDFQFWVCFFLFLMMIGVGNGNVIVYG